MSNFFHVHTYRCGHAANIPDEDYIKTAISLGGKKIVFTDHAPFPGDPFINRMKYEELPRYLSSLTVLREIYQEKIEVVRGLEIEYLPSFDDYYRQLVNSKELDLLILGQHHYEISSKHYSFEENLSESENVIGLAKSMISGIESGYFKVAAHPDRIFRKVVCWNSLLEHYSNKIIKAALDNNVLLEKNYSSMKQNNCFRKEFWKNVDESNVIYGYDAHSIKDLLVSK